MYVIFSYVPFLLPKERCLQFGNHEELASLFVPRGLQELPPLPTEKKGSWFPRT